MVLGAIGGQSDTPLKSLEDEPLEEVVTLKLLLIELPNLPIPGPVF